MTIDTKIETTRITDVCTAVLPPHSCFVSPTIGTRLNWTKLSLSKNVHYLAILMNNTIEALTFLQMNLACFCSYSTADGRH